MKNGWPETVITATEQPESPVGMGGRHLSQTEVSWGAGSPTIYVAVGGPQTLLISLSLTVHLQERERNSFNPQGNPSLHHPPRHLPGVSVGWEAWISWGNWQSRLPLSLSDEHVAWLSVSLVFKEKYFPTTWPLKASQPLHLALSWRKGDLFWL